MVECSSADLCKLSVQEVVDFLVDHEKNGVICDDFTSDALKRGIETLLKREYSAEEIRQDMIDRFSPDSIAEKYRQLYKKILK